VVRTLFTGAAVAAGVFLEELVRPLAENHPWRVAIVLALAAATVGLLYLAHLVLSDQPNRFWVAPALFVLGGLGWGLVVGWDNRDNYLTPYCEYGARSQEQLDGCLAHVNSDDIDALDSPAARFARGETSRCGDGSGPFCEP
jgi:hypothetical protein